MWERTAVVVLSAWVLFAGYVWPHTRANLINNWIVGVGLLVFGTVAFERTWARYVTLVLAAWLFVSSALSNSIDPRAFWSNAIVAVLVFAMSLLGPTKDWFSRPSETSHERG